MARIAFDLAKEIYLSISPVMLDNKPNYSWRETAAKIAIRYAGYCAPGPLRPPFIDIPMSVEQAQKTRAVNWRKLCDKYKPLLERTAAE